MVVYVDSSALVKRVIAEGESDAVEDALAGHVGADDVLVSSSLAWIEVERTARAALRDDDETDVGDIVVAAMAGVGERPIALDVVSLARRIEPRVLRSLDAIHVATAVLIDADVVITFDDRLAAAARSNSLRVDSPSGARRSGPTAAG